MKQYRILVFPVLLLSLFSCKKVIDVKETDFIGGDIALKTVANNEQGIIGAYSGLGTEMDILFNAVVSDEVKVGEFTNSATVHGWQYNSTDISIRDNFVAFNLFYRGIDRVNRVLQTLPKADSTRIGDETLRSKLRGEALFLRAFCHFELFRYYCGNYDPAGLALAYSEVPSLEPQARITMGPYFQKLNADLAQAKALLPNNLSDVYRATRLAATGLQARVALYTKDWTNAITYSTEYINAIPLSTRANFNAIWTDAPASVANEVAFRFKRTATSSGPLSLVPSGNTYTTNTSRLGSLFRPTSSTATSLGQVTWFVSDKLFNSYDKVNDIRYSSYIKDEPLLSNANRFSHIVQKYAGTGYATTTENVADAKVFRTGEMYLIRAEAKVETSDLTGAAADINALRTARVTGYTSISYASKDLAITDIIQERFKELAFEGNRFWDLKRRSLPVERLASDAPSPAAAVLPANNFRFLLPIPNVEIQANRLIQQNPGYTN